MELYNNEHNYNATNNSRGQNDHLKSTKPIKYRRILGEEKIDWTRNHRMVHSLRERYLLVRLRK